jgi:hypothetical protein
MTAIFKRLISFLFDLLFRFRLNKKITRIYKSISSPILLSNEKINIHKNLWSKIGSKPNSRWYKVYSFINHNFDPQYITEVDYYTKVEPTLNNRAFSEAYSDKNFYHKYLDTTILPAIYLRNIQGVYYDQAYKTINSFNEIGDVLPPGIHNVIIKKAVGSGGGRDVELFTKIGLNWKNVLGNILSKSYLEQVFRSNFIVQEYIQQHAYFNQFNHSSVNTIRLFTYRSVKTNVIIPLQSVLRIGQPGALVDNQASGGIACGIDSTGKLVGFGVNKMGEKLFVHNGISLKDIDPVYKYHEVVDLGLKIASNFHYHRLLGFDFSIDKDGQIRLIEINNSNNEINFYQMNNGPLFREYTNDIIEFCQHNSKTVCFDYEV